MASAPTPRAMVAAARMTDGKIHFFGITFSSSTLIMVSPQKQFMNTLSNEYKTNKLDINASASNTYVPDSTAPLPTKYLPMNPLRGGTPASDNVVIKTRDRKSTRLNSSHVSISYAVFCLKKKKT